MSSAGVLFESKEGRRAMQAKVVVDATGDLDVGAGAEHAFESDADSEATRAPTA